MTQALDSQNLSVRLHLTLRNVSAAERAMIDSSDERGPLIIEIYTRPANPNRRISGHASHLVFTAVVFQLGPSRIDNAEIKTTSL